MAARTPAAPVPSAAAAPSSGFSVPEAWEVVGRLARVTGELASAETLGQIVTVVAQHMSAAVNAAVSALWLLDGDELVLAGSSGLSGEKASRWARIALDARTPLSDAMREGAPTVAGTPDVVRRDYPLMAADTPPGRSVVSLPLHAAGQVIGAIGMTFEQNWTPGPSELEFLMTFADACAQALRRVRATEEAARSAAQVRFLASASTQLASSLDYRGTLTKVSQLAVPLFSSWCAVHLLDDSGTLQPIALAHADPDKVEWAWQLAARYPVDMDAPSGAPNVVRTGVGELICEISDEMLVASAQDDEHLRLARELRMRSVIMVPLTARGRVLGTMTLIRTDDAPAFDDSDLTVAEDLGRRAGVAIDNARLHQHAVTIADELQRALLPDRLPTVPGWQTAGFYRPDGTAEVGGDFFDAVALRDGRLVVFIGDVMGHGISAAATMAQLRASMRTLATIDPDPATVMGRLDDLFDELALEPLVSVVFALVEPGGHVSLANAGHTPPLVRRPDGTATYLSSTGRPPLGTGRRPDNSVLQVDLEPGSVLVLYTDGLVERRRENIDLGLERLSRAVELLGEGKLAETLPRLAAEVAGDQPGDDVALLALCREC